MKTIYLKPMIEEIPVLQESDICITTSGTDEFEIFEGGPWDV